MRGLYLRWRQGMRDLTPLQILEGKRISMYGQALGLLVAMVYLVSEALYPWLLVVAFTLSLVVFEILSVSKSVDRIKGFGGR